MECEVFNRNLCLGCTRFAVKKTGVGPEQCEHYKKYKNMSGLELCKNILEGTQIKLMWKEWKYGSEKSRR